MKKKLIFPIALASCMTFTPISIFANSQYSENTNSYVTIEEGKYIGSIENNSYYLNGNELIKVTIENTEEKVDTNQNKIKSLDEERYIEKKVNLSVYKTNLTDNEAITYQMARSGNLDMYDTAMNPMGNIKAKLKLTYNLDRYNNLFHLCKATGSYETIISEGVIPETSEFHWNASGSIYRNGSFVKNGHLGDTKNFRTPTFSNVQMMDENESLKDVTVAGASYTLYCTRGVTINVFLPIDSNIW